MALTSIENTSAGIGEFSKAILSVWFCRDSNNDASYVFQTATADPATSHGAYFQFRYDGSQWVIQVKLYHTNTSTQLFDGTFTAASTPVHTLANILLSFDTAIETIQVYVNDAAATVSSASWASSSTVNAGVIAHWTLTGSENLLGIADLYFTTGFSRDLSQAVERRAFVSADVHPVDAIDGFLVTGGSPPVPLAIRPTGFPPPVFLSCRDVESPADFVTNYGVGGPWSVVNGPLVRDFACRPAYTPVEVEFPVTDGGNTSLDSTAAGFGEFSQAALSVWMCRNPGDASLTFQSVSDNHAVSYAASITIGYTGTGPWTIGVDLYHTNTGDQIYAGAYTSPATPDFALANILLSFDTAANAAQVYVNEDAATATTDTWSSTGTVNAGAIDHWNLEVVGSIADFYFEPDSYFDLSVAANRWLFHEPDLTAIDLEQTVSHTVAFFTVRSGMSGGGIASDFAYNDSSGPTWDIINGPLVLGDGCAAGAPVEDPGTPADLLPGQIVFWGLTLGGGSDLSTPAGDAVGGGASNILFTGLKPSGSDLNSPVVAAGQIIFTGRKPGAIFVRYRDPRSPSFFAVELNVYTTDSPGEEILRVSDIGYRSRASDTIGLHVYPSVVNLAFDIDRHLSLEPGQPSSAGFGSVVLHNLSQRYDTYTLVRNSDSRNIRILVGNKTTDSDRGVLVDPPYAELRPFFGGAALPWTLSEGSLEIPLRDATYWADRPLQTKLYAGTGGYEGGDELKGKPVPVTRGGGGMGAGAFVQNVPLVLVDKVALIYQWTDGPGDVSALYEGGAQVFSREADVTDLYTGAPAPGAFRVDKTRGLLQVGSVPVRQLTADVSGSFAVAGVKTTAVDIARYVLTETMGQPESELELASWYNSDARYPYAAGFWQGAEQVSGLDVVRFLLGSIGARLFTFRDGRLGVAILRALPDDAVPSFTINQDRAISVDPTPLPKTLDPPPWRWRIGSFRMNLVQASDFDEAIDPTRKANIAQEYPFLASAEAPELKDIWRRPNDPEVVPTALLNTSAAQDLATDMLALWRGRPNLYEVTMPYEQSAELEIGDVVTLDWPLADLEGGKAGQVVGEQVRSYDGTGKIYVLAG
jgi:hypothetical protein